MRRNGGARRGLRAASRRPAWYDDAERLITTPRWTPSTSRPRRARTSSYALAVCAAGKPAYVEKPMARSHAECRRMVEAFAAARVPLFVAYYRRALDRFRKTRELVEGGALGRVTGVAVRFAGPHHRALDGGPLPWRLSAADAGGGLFLDLGCHTLDVLDLVLGPLADVRGSGGQRRLAACGRGHGRDDVRHGRRRAGDRALELRQRRARGRDRRFRAKRARSSSRPSATSRSCCVAASIVETFDLPNPPHIQQPMIQSVVDELLGSGRAPSTGVTAARTSAVMDTVLAGYYGGRDDEFWARPDTWPGRRHIERRAEETS